MLYNKMEWERNSSEKKQLLRNIKELEVERDKALSNANSHLLGSKEDIQNHIKVRLMGLNNLVDQLYYYSLCFWLGYEWFSGLIVT